MGLFTMPKRRAVGVFIVAVSSICLIVFAVSLAFTMRFLGNAQQVQGTIVDLIPGTVQGETVTYPVFAFNDAAGIEHVVHSRFGVEAKTYSVGDHIQVYYNANDPDAARIKGFAEVWMLPTISGALGVLYFPVGLVVWFWPVIWGKVRGKKLAGTDANGPGAAAA